MSDNSQMADAPEPVTDWRGIEIKPGQTVIYGAGVSRSISPTEGVVESIAYKERSYKDWDKKGRTSTTVRVRIARTAFGYRAGKPVVNVLPGRLTVVDSLPATEVPTMKEKMDKDEAEAQERLRLMNTHTGVDIVVVHQPGHRGHTIREYEHRGCSVCGCTYHDAYKMGCPGPPSGPLPQWEIDAMNLHEAERQRRKDAGEPT